MAKKPRVKDVPSSDQEMQLVELRRQLEEERLKNIALQELIKVAEERFNIPIRKKPGAKQS